MTTRFLVELTSPMLVSVEVDADDESDAIMQGVVIFRADLSSDDFKAAPIERATKRYKTVSE